MSAVHSKSAFVYTQVRRALQSGHYLPGQRIDPAGLAAEFNTSPTPVRFALYRLVGEGLLADHARSGLYVPLLTEVALRDLYDWMERLLLIACEVGPAPIASARIGAPDPGAVEEDVVKATWKLFDAMARSTGHRYLHDAVKRTNDRLAPVRRAKRHLLDDPAVELGVLTHLWDEGDIDGLRAALQRYYARRKRLVPCIVATMNEGRERLH